MKKILTLILILAMTLCAVAIPVSADGEVAVEGTVKKATPVVDGQIDEAYLESHKIVTDTSSVIYLPVEYHDDELVATTYFLHDGEYLYIVSEVTGDTNVVDGGMDDWVNDSVEVWISSIAPPPEAGKQNLYTKVPMGAFGQALPNGAIGGLDNLLEINLQDSEAAATQTENGYITEVKVPLYFYNHEQTMVSVNVQVNNIDSAELNSANVGALGCSGFFGEQYDKYADTGHKLLLEGMEPVVVETEPEATEPAATEPAATEPADAQPAESSVSMGALIATAVICLLIGTACGAAAATFLGKKKKNAD